MKQHFQRRYASTELQCIEQLALENNERIWQWGSDKGLCPLGSWGEGSFVTVKLDPPPFLGGVPLSRYTGCDVLDLHVETSKGDSKTP